MQRVLMAFFVANSIVLIDVCEFPPYETPKSVEGGLISSSTTKTYSVLEHKVCKQSIHLIKFFYDHLDKIGGIIPKIIGASDAGNGKDCYLYFENVFRMDIKTYVNTKSIRAVYMKLIDALKLVNFSSDLNFSKNAFVYDPSTQTFLFAELEALIKSSKNTYDGTLEKFSLEYFSDWVYTNKIPIFTSDIAGVSSYSKPLNELPYFEEYKLRYKEDIKEKELKIVETIDFNPSKEPSIELEVKVTKDNRSSVLIATLNNKKRTLTFDNAKDMFSINLCKNSGQDVIECVKLDEKSGGSDLVWKHNVMPNQRIDLEVQEGESKINDLVMKFYKVNLILTSENYPGVVPEGEFLIKLRENTNISDYYLLCETNHKDLRVPNKYYYFKLKSLRMKNNLVINSTGRKIFQTTLSAFGYFNETCIGSNKKFFIIKKEKQDKDKYLLMNETRDKNALDLSFIDKTPGSTIDAIAICNKTLNIPDFAFIINPLLDLKNTNRLHSYPRKAFITLSQSSKIIVDDFCVRFKEASQSYILDYEVESVRVQQGQELDFKYNFNSHDEQRILVYNENNYTFEENIVYLTTKDTKNSNEFEFKNFQFPNALQDDIYISINATSENLYEVRIIFVSETYHFREITKVSENYITLQKMPSKIIYNKKNSCIFNDPGEFLFKETDVSYLSSSEIVFIVDIPGFSGCKPILETTTNENGQQDLKISCSFIEKLKFWKYAGNEIKNVNSLPRGLNRIISQTSLTDQKII